MLRRINADKFEAPSGATVQIVTRSKNNNSVNSAQFEYDHTILPAQTIAGMPGCTITVAAGIKAFEAVVVFDPGFPVARYDAFEVDASGGMIDLQEDVFASDPLPRIAFRIEGVPTLAAAAPAPTRKAGRKRATKGARKKRP